MKKTRLKARVTTMEELDRQDAPDIADPSTTFVYAVDVPMHEFKTKANVEGWMAHGKKNEFSNQTIWDNSQFVCEENPATAFTDELDGGVYFGSYVRGIGPFIWIGKLKDGDDFTESLRNAMRKAKKVTF